MDVEPRVLSTDSGLGTEYLEAMRLAGDYAYAGRDWVCGRVAHILGAPIVEEVALPSQLRLARRARRRAVVGCTQRCDAGLSWPARICWRHDGRAVGHSRRS